MPLNLWMGCVVCVLVYVLFCCPSPSFCSSGPFYCLRNALEQRFTPSGGKYLGMKGLCLVVHGEIQGHGERVGTRHNFKTQI